MQAAAQGAPQPAPQGSPQPAQQYAPPAQAMPYSQGPQPGQQGQPGQQQPFSGLAIFAFISAFIIGLLGLIMAFVAASNIGRTGKRGKGLAVAAMIIGAVNTLFQIIVGIILVVGLIAGSILVSNGAQSIDSVEVPLDDSSSPMPAGWAPQNMNTGGAVFTGLDEVVESPALSNIAERSAYQPGPGAPEVTVEIYADYMCPACGAFEADFGEMLEERLAAGDIALGVHPISFLDRLSGGTAYSTRAANLFACTVDQQPGAAFSLHRELLDSSVQPEEGTTGLDNERLLSIAEGVGVDVDQAFTECVEQQQFSDFVTQTTNDVLNGQGVLGLKAGETLAGGVGNAEPGSPQTLYSTPTVIVNGVEWVGDGTSTLEERIDEALGEAAK